MHIKYRNMSSRGIVDAFYGMGFFSLKDTYLIQGGDYSTTVTSITVSNSTKTVTSFDDVAPQNLVELQSMIDKVAGSDRWTRGPGG